MHGLLNLQNLLQLFLLSIGHIQPRRSDFLYLLDRYWPQNQAGLCDVGFVFRIVERRIESVPERFYPVQLNTKRAALSRDRPP